MYGSVSEKPEKPAPARGGGQHILVVDDETRIAELLATTLELAGYRVGTAATGGEALDRVGRERPDLVILDVMLPDMDGFTVCRRLVAADEDHPPVLFLTARDSLDSLVTGLGIGGNDYVTKPFRIAEVLARVQAQLRTRSRRREEPSPRYADLVLDDTTRQARRGQRTLALTPGEFRLLRYLLVNAGQVLSKEQIGEHLWLAEHRRYGDNAIEKLVSRLRHKVDGAGPALIHTRRGFGYWLGRLAQI
ncbi:response regulator transcription factor [Streptomyces sp. NPDC044780]|uniref:Response regulator transcription factor n=1 Tax=Streptomyces luomodiensis TaxID=3026192 RepID=A0ABY9UW96_9ACTN|nr:MULTISPECIES: response regulator transcription factor [unclassified Streptomyces]WAP55734.1 response regulator transcription factor [Streptomyces sp. S465]WNE96262.1 response regulator transcription factor [Streptomyces sp. SCA4-21]